MFHNTLGWSYRIELVVGYRIGWSYRILDRVVRYSSKYIIYILGRIELVVGYRIELKDTISRIQDAELLRRL